MKVTKFSPVHFEDSNVGKFRKDKGLTGGYILQATNGTEIFDIAEVRFYFLGRDGMSPVYCAFWVHNDNHTSGGGKASGCGYHKESAAFEFAANSAGVYFSEPVSGVGSLQIEKALLAIGEAQGYENLHITRFHA